jgi:hypothetical protein
MVVWLWWQENHQKKGEAEELPQPSAEVSLHQHSFSSERALLALSFLRCLMLIWLWWQDNDDQRVKDEILDASTDVSVALLVFCLH